MTFRLAAEFDTFAVREGPADGTVDDAIVGWHELRAGDGRTALATVYDRGPLPAGASVEGSALLEEETNGTVVGAGLSIEEA